MSRSITHLIRKYITFIKFLFVGALNTLFGYVIYSFFIWLGLHYSLASLLGTIIGIVFNFFTTGRLVFKNSDNSLIFKFFCVYGIVWLFNVFCTWLITLTGYTNLYVIGFILIFPCSVLSYLLMKTFVFGTKKQTVANNNQN